MIRQKVKEMLSKFVERDYVGTGKARSLVSFFSVPKGESDIRVVFYGNKPGLNHAIWAPTFGLNTIDSLLPILSTYWTLRFRLIVL